jgi:hypothetical protein
VIPAALSKRAQDRPHHVSGDQPVTFRCEMDVIRLEIAAQRRSPPHRNDRDVTAAEARFD